MRESSNLFYYSSSKTKGLYCFSSHANGDGLPEKFSPWQALGVLRADQTPPHGISRKLLEAGVHAHGYQLLRKKSETVARKEEGTEPPCASSSVTTMSNRPCGF